MIEQATKGGAMVATTTSSSNAKEAIKKVKTLIIGNNPKFPGQDRGRDGPGGPGERC